MTRVRKNIARKLWNEGKSLIMLPCNVRVDNMYGLGYESNKDDEGAQGYTFDEVVNIFESYNCNIGLGRYTAFYMAD